MDAKDDTTFNFTPWMHSAGASPNEFDQQTNKIKLVLVLEDLGDRPTPAVQRLTSKGLWASLVKILFMLHDSITGVGDSKGACFMDIDDALASMEYKLSVLKTLIGERNNDQGTASIFEILGASSSSPSVQFSPLAPADTPKFRALVATVEALNLDFKHFRRRSPGQFMRRFNKVLPPTCLTRAAPSKQTLRNS
ncbi:hypothetical protein ACA910_008389 [Epithemia clementina (nom. ined.)]